MTFAQGFTNLLEEIYNYTDEEAVSFYTSLLYCTDAEALEVFAIFKKLIDSGMKKEARNEYKKAMNALRAKYGEDE